MWQTRQLRGAAMFAKSLGQAGARHDEIRHHVPHKVPMFHVRISSPTQRRNQECLYRTVMRMTQPVCIAVNCILRELKFG
jgi:hypothetical protein